MLQFLTRQFKNDYRRHLSASPRSVPVTLSQQQPCQAPPLFDVMWAGV
ncbi:MAG TPA: hypothetical protein VKU01_19095 [Bryobacteraceae bacterium]|nr:hypothetical protein [Bryobacteraceae bacterium]